MTHRIANDDRILRDEVSVVGEVLGAKMRCTKPKRVMEPGDLLRRKCKWDDDTERRDADLGNRSDIRETLLVIFIW